MKIIDVCNKCVTNNSKETFEIYDQELEKKKMGKQMHANVFMGARLRTGLEFLLVNNRLGLCPLALVSFVF